MLTWCPSLLASYDYPGEKLRLVTQCILTHRASTQLPAATAEEVCLRNADAAAHITAVPSLLYMIYVHKKLSIDEGRRRVSNKLRRSWGKLCPEVRDLLSARYEAALTTLEDQSF